VAQRGMAACGIGGGTRSVHEGRREKGARARWAGSAGGPSWASHGERWAKWLNGPRKV
jgi:hypothetical protein